MNDLSVTSFWYEISIWANATFLNYSIKANDTSNNWIVTFTRVLAFKVHNLDSGENFIQIQHAIDDADTLDGHRIFVENGIYYENVIVDKTLNLTGEDKVNTIIDGDENGDVCVILADSVNLSEFTLQNSGIIGWPDHDAGLELKNVLNCNIKNNIVQSNLYGILLDSSSHNNLTGNNVSSNDRYGIRLISSQKNHLIDNLALSNNWSGIALQSWSENNTIINNSALGNNNQGIILYLSANNDVINNTVTFNEHGIWIGMSSFNNITNNIVIHNNDQGINLYDDSYNITIEHNNVSDNLDGISTYNSFDNTIKNNDIILNNQYGLYIRNSNNNTIYHNNIVRNINQAYDDKSDNSWDNGYPSGGNFWSDYRGDDFFSGPNQDLLGNDGIGDTNYTIDSDSVDNYPLMFPSGDYIFLYKGWNLISIPFIQPDTNLSSVLNTIEGSWDTIWWYNTSDSQDKWKLNNTSKIQSMNHMNKMNNSMGIWIHITDPNGTLFLYPGVQPTENQKILLNAGWNLVGFPSLTRKDRTSALNTLTFGNEVDSMWTFNAASKKWDEIGSSDYFEVGRGYWIHANSKCVWEVPL
jgi:parallel beta-helix repeat protein